MQPHTAVVLTVLALLWLTLAAGATSGTGTTAAFQYRSTQVLILGVAVVLLQSAEQRCREVEAADAASVARLVRGMSVVAVRRNATLSCLCSITCVPSW